MTKHHPLMPLPSPLSGPQKTTNPRRTPAHLSVSLVRGRPLRNPQCQSSLSHTANPPSQSGSPVGKRPAARQPQGNGNDSGQNVPSYDRKHSSAESSDAGKWFETSNNNVAAAHPTLMDGKLLIMPLFPSTESKFGWLIIVSNSRRTSFLPAQLI